MEALTFTYIDTDFANAGETLAEYRTRVAAARSPRHMFRRAYRRFARR